MNARFQNFSAEKLAFRGLAGWGAHLPDNTLLRHSLAGWLSPALLDQATSRLLSAAEELTRFQLQPQRLCWTFEHVRVCMALRPDRWGRLGQG